MWRPSRTSDMKRILTVTTLLGATTGCSAPNTAEQAADLPRQPNVIFILADDLGYGDLGCYGQEVIATPCLDTMAQQGLRFTQFYAGSTVCAPSRSVLMTGQHLGHTWVRGNSRGPGQTLRAEDVTVAELFQEAGYRTALIGKWGLGEAGTTGHPVRQGFDSFFGYLNQRHAHNYYPDFLWRNEAKVELDNVVIQVGGSDSLGGYATHKGEYSHDLFMNETQLFLREHRSDPFFLYLSLTIPHANNEASAKTGNGAEVPDYGIYADKDWPNPDKGQAAMITRMDRDLGALLDTLRKLDIDDDTLVIFTSDNGPHNESRHNIERFDPSGPLRGIKRALYEGGIRVPTIAWWPGTIEPGRTSGHIAYFGDFLATACDLAHVEAPDNVDSISFLPELLGEPQPEHDYLYWEFYEQGSRQAVRKGKWKAIREPMLSGPTALYDLSEDLGETTDLAADHPGIVAEMEALMDEARTPSPHWLAPSEKKQKKD
jgi:arylsulfatase A-like enzyme